MKKSRGQSVIEFVVLGALAVGIIIFGVYQFGDGLADFFQRNNVEQKFNAGRTVKFERPQDILSNVKVSFDGMDIEPPVEAVIRGKLSGAGGTYIQTSGSAGRIAMMAEMMMKYVEELDQLIDGSAEGTAFKTALDDYKKNLRDPGDTNGDGSQGFLEIHDAYTAVNGTALEQKLNLIEMALSFTSTLYSSEVATKRDDYLSTLSVTSNEYKIVELFSNDLLNFDNSLDYFIDPVLYVEYLNQEKKSPTDSVQDQALVDAIQAASLSAEQKAYVAGLIKIIYGGGYSQASPKAYNGERMCNTFSGTLDTATNVCTIPTP